MVSQCNTVVKQDECFKTAHSDEVFIIVEQYVFHTLWQVVVP